MENSQIYNYSKLSDKELIRLAGSIEEKSTHPIGKAFVEYMQENKILKSEVKNIENIVGYGLTGEVENKKIILEK